MKKVIVLGAGAMGIPIALGLKKDYEVSISDINEKSLCKAENAGLVTKKIDLSNPENIPELIKDYDLVVSALPESFGYEALKTIILTGKNVVDISFWLQNRKKVLALQKIAKEKSVTALIDCGIAPGMSNATVAHLDKILEGKTEKVEIFVGGIPLEKDRSFFINWSIKGLIEEYLRKALCVKDGKKKKVPALSEIKQISFSNIGRLEGAITDGLRSLPYSFPHIKNMKEYTLRYPGHFGEILLLKKIGYFDERQIETEDVGITAIQFTKLFLKKKWKTDEIYNILSYLGFLNNWKIRQCKDKKISPKEIATQILADEWRPGSPEFSSNKDILVMRIIASNKKTKYVSDFYAKHDHFNSAMAITTGGTAILCAKILLEKRFFEKGVFPLEKIGKDDKLFAYLINNLKQMKVGITEYEERIDF